MQFIMGDLFKDFPTLKLIIPHGGGAVPYHWGRYRGLAQNNKRPPLEEMMRNNVFFDTCVYHQPGIDLLTKVVPIDNILFASEMVGAVRGNDPQTGSISTTPSATSTRAGAVRRGQEEDFRAERVSGLSPAQKKCRRPPRAGDARIKVD